MIPSIEKTPYSTLSQEQPICKRTRGVEFKEKVTKVAIPLMLIIMADQMPKTGAINPLHFTGIAVAAAATAPIIVWIITVLGLTTLIVGGLAFAEMKNSNNKKDDDRRYQAELNMFDLQID